MAFVGCAVGGGWGRVLESRWRGILVRLRVTKAGRFSANAKKCPQCLRRARISYYPAKTMITLTMLVMEKIIKFMKMKNEIGEYDDER